MASSLQAATPQWSHRDSAGNVVVDFYVFWSKTCEHCHVAVPYVKDLAKKNPWIKLHLKEVTSSSSNIDQYISLANATGGRAGAVPAFIYCGQMYTGYGDNSTTGAWLFDELKTCKATPGEFNIKH